MEYEVPKIRIENGAFKKIPAHVGKYGKKFTIITDGNIKKLGNDLLSAMRKSGLSCNLIILPPGEHTKSISFVEKIATHLVNLGNKRDSCLIALGGGVVGDLTGFVASIFMRGINYVSVPTTMLAMCDSGIGGKTGVDLPEGKNLLGTFYNPKEVIIDPLLVTSLPEKQIRIGMAEVIKHAVLADAQFFKFLNQNTLAILSKKPTVLKQTIAKSVQIKLSIVKKDGREMLQNTERNVSRMLLNYGHTVGHALEKLSKFALSHGEAIAIGMVAENRIAVGKKLLKEIDAVKIESLIKKFGLPIKMPQEYSPAQLETAMGMDKKHIDGKLFFALPLGIGKAKILHV